MVVPPGWQELPNATAFVLQYTELQIIDLVEQNSLGGLDALLEEYGQVPSGKTTAGFRMFREGGEFRVWFTLQDLPA